MPGRQSIVRTIFLSSTIILFILIFMFGFILIYQEYQRMKSETEGIEKRHIEEQKQLIRNEVQRVIDYAEYKHSLTQDRIRLDIRERVYDAHAIATRLHELNKDRMVTAELKRLIVETLRPIRFNNGRGYYFATRLDGVEQLFADRPELENKNLIDEQDTRGKYVIRDMIAIARSTGEGYIEYYWTKPGETGRDFPKLAYIKYFEPFDMFIGTGEYLDDVEKDIQQETLGRINKIRFGNDGYVFVIRSDGVMLSHIRKDLVGKNQESITDPSGVRVIRELIKASRRPGGDFVTYIWPKPSTGVQTDKLSYALFFDKWGWVIGTGVYLDDMERVIAAAQKDYQYTVLRQIFFMLSVLISFIIISLLITHFISKKMQMGIATFLSFFHEAATSYQKIDPELLGFSEFKTIGEYANNLVGDFRQAQESLRREKDKAQMYLDIAGVMFIAIDAQGTVVLVNRKGCEILGCDEHGILGKNWFETFLPEDERTLVKSVFREIVAGNTEPFQYVENRIRNRKGEERVIAWHNTLIRDESGAILGTLSSGEDITERKKAERDLRKAQQQLQQTQKMEAIGTLAGGIAHDFNNILASIIGYSELALQDAQKNSQLQLHLMEVLKAANRARDLTKRILAFSRQDEGEAKPVMVRSIVQEALKLLRATLPSTIAIKTEITTDGLVMADPTQVHQVIMNLCTNAAHAMEKDGGILGIKLSEEVLGQETRNISLTLTPGAYVVLTVSDTGHGIPHEIVDKIFDPYFSTKEKGKGTGLGLAIVHGIVTKFQGEITLTETSGQGSIFRVYLPKIIQEAMAEQKREEQIPGGSERILFVDDEPALATLAKHMLERLGYHVTTRTSSVEALELFKADPSRFDLVISDMTMPSMTGDRLAQEVFAIRPGIPFILCTGFSELISEEKARHMGIRAFALKPLVRRDFAFMIRRVLDGGQDQ